MENTITTEKTKIHNLSIKNEGVPLREKIPVIETHTVKLLFGGEKTETPNTHFSLNEIHPARFTRRQIAFINHMISEIGLERREEECLDIISVMEKGQ